MAETYDVKARDLVIGETILVYSAQRREPRKGKIKRVSNGDGQTKIWLRDGKITPMIVPSETTCQVVLTKA